MLFPSSYICKLKHKIWQYCDVAKKRDLAIIIIIIIIIITIIIIIIIIIIIKQPSNLHHSLMSAESYLSPFQDVNFIRRFETVHELVSPVAFKGTGISKIMCTRNKD